MAIENSKLREGLFDRVYALFEVLPRLPEELSEEEVEGLIKALPADLKGTFRSLLRPSLQEATIPFFNLLFKWLNEAKQAKSKGKKVVFVPFNFNPEIIHCFDNLFPLTSEILNTLGVLMLQGQGERYWDYAMGMGLPDHLCSANAIEVGSALTGLDFKPDAIISATPGACDVNAKIHEFLALYLDVPQFVIEKIPDNTTQGVKLFKKNFNRLVFELEKFAGEKLREEKMREVAEKANHCMELYYDLWELKKIIPCPVPGIFSSGLILGVRFAMWGREESIDMLERMIRISRQNMEDAENQSRPEVARVFWSYLNYYFDLVNLCDWLEENQISNMGDLVQINFMRPIDTGSMDSILDGMAENAWDTFMTRQMGGDSMSQRWVDDLVYVTKELNLNGVIFCGHHACKQTWSVFSIAREEVLKRSGVPTLGLQGDSWNRTMTPISVIKEEIEQFINNVVTKKTKTRRRPRAKT